MQNWKNYGFCNLWQDCLKWRLSLAFLLIHSVQEKSHSFDKRSKNTKNTYICEQNYDGTSWSSELINWLPTVLASHGRRSWWLIMMIYWLDFAHNWYFIDILIYRREFLQTCQSVDRLQAMRTERANRQILISKLPNIEFQIPKNRGQTGKYWNPS